MYSRFLWADDRRQLVASKSVLDPSNWPVIVFLFVQTFSSVEVRPVAQVLCDDWRKWPVHVPTSPAVRRILVWIKFWKH